MNHLTLLQAIEKYGKRNQLIVACEEMSELQKELSKGSISLCNLAKLLNGVDNCYDCEHFGGFDSDGVAICEVNAHAQEVLCKAHCSVNGIDRCTQCKYGECHEAEGFMCNILAHFA